MERYFKLVERDNPEFGMFCVEMHNGRFPDEETAVKDAIRRLVLICHGTYAEALENHLERVYDDCPELEKELVTRASPAEWKVLFKVDPIVKTRFWPWLSYTRLLSCGHQGCETEHSALPALESCTWH